MASNPNPSLWILSGKDVAASEEMDSILRNGPLQLTKIHIDAASVSPKYREYFRLRLAELDGHARRHIVLDGFPSSILGEKKSTFRPLTQDSNTDESKVLV